MVAVFEARSANDVWLKAYSMLKAEPDVVQISRLGYTREILHASFYISDPRQRWVLSRIPAMNPAFAIAEVFWILSGSNDAAFLNYWNPILPRYSGSGNVYHGAYGYRLRQQFGFDQLEKAYNVLKNDPSSRQVVLQIWDPGFDFPNENGQPVNQDIPCNICAVPKIRNGRLEWLQVMRSNDIFLGSPHNFVQFSTLQEILAGWLGLELGGYYQVSDSLHIYEKDLSVMGEDTSIAIPLNTDSLLIDKNSFDQQMNIIIPKLNALVGNDLDKKEFCSLLKNDLLKESYKNLFVISAADAARRRGWNKEMDFSLSLCSNKLLRLAFNRWVERRSGTI